MLGVGDPGSNFAVTGKRIDLWPQPERFSQRRPRLVHIAAEAKRARKI
jgi:hypothetical protein